MKNYLIEQNKNIKDALVNLENNKSKCLLVVDKNNTLKGTLTDGDIRRAMLQNANLSSSIKKYVKKKPLYIDNNNSTKEYIHKFIKKIKDESIDLIPVLSNDFKVKEIIFKSDFENFTKKKLSPNIPVLIMAGGKGVRLKQFTNYFPKPLVPFEDVTALEYIINSFKKYDFKKFFISLNYKKNLIKSYLKESGVKNLTYIEEKSFLGTAGSISLLKKKVKTDFFLINCDTILSSINYDSLYSYHKKNNYKITLVAAAKSYILPYGSCEIKKNRELKKIKEKPTINQFANVGLYLIKPEVITLVKKNKNLGMDELIQKVKLSGGKVGVFPVSGDSWIDTGSTNTLQK